MVKCWKQTGLVLALAISLLPAAVCRAAERATVIREATLYASSNPNTQKLAQVERGRDLTVLEQGSAEGKPWVKVSMPADQQAQITQELTGWLPAQALITASTPNGDQIVFGEAVDSEHQAEERGGRKGAAEDAMRLYARVPELFPGSALAAEGLWRSADIRWQLAKSNYLRSGAQLEEKYLNEVITKYPHSRQAELAAYDLLEAKLCAEWRGLAECPQKESTLFEQYAVAHPQSPKAAEALYNAAWRQAALVDIYRIENKTTESDAARKKATTLAQEIANQYPQSDWKARAMDLIYKLEKKIPMYGLAE
jgi:TolA-binding protein